MLCFGYGRGVHSFGRNSLVRKLIHAGSAALLLTGLARRADAQIYAWRDAGGTLVLSDRPTDPAARTFDVAGTERIRATKARPGYPNIYDFYIEKHAAQQRVRPELVRAVIQVESAFNPFARSPKGATGLMQLMPDTAADLRVRNLYNPAENIRGGVTYLRQLLDRYDNNEELALAAYNAGPGRVDRSGRRVPQIAETRAYVSKVHSAAPLPTRPTAVVYKIVDTIGGRLVPRYSNAMPSSGAFEIVETR